MKPPSLSGKTKAEVVEAIRQTYRDEVVQSLDALTVEAKRMAREAANDLIRRELGLERDNWGGNWRFSSTRDSPLRAIAQAAAFDTLAGLKFDAIVLSDKELTSIRVAYRRAYVAAIREHAIDDARAAARAVAEDVVGPLSLDLLDEALA